MVLDVSLQTRSACVICGAAPDAVAAVATSDAIVLRENELGTVVTGKPGELVIDYAASFDGPVYDVMYNARTGWFVVTIYRGLEPPVRWDNRPDANPGHPRVETVLGASTPTSILLALGIDAAELDYAPS